MIEQEHEEEVKALRQEKYSLQQKLHEAELKWNHYITQQTVHVSKQLLTLYTICYYSGKILKD